MQSCRICWYLSSCRESAFHLVQQWIILWQLGKTNRLLKEVNNEIGSLVGFISVRVRYDYIPSSKNLRITHKISLF